MKTTIETYLNSLSEEILTLSIECRGITSLPDLTRFKNLKELYCSDNQITSLPTTLPQGLEILYCSNNQLTSLPTTLPQGLEILYCSNNQLTSLPDLIRFKNLREFNCYKNQITSLPTALPQSLETLCCFDNQLTYLPTLPEKTVYFYYTNNPICNILDIDNNSLIKVKQNIKIVNNFRHLFDCLQFKKKFIKWLWKSREKKIMEKYHPNYLLDNLEENTDLDEVLNKW